MLNKWAVWLFHIVSEVCTVWPSSASVLHVYEAEAPSLWSCLLQGRGLVPG